jgi:hypothetical protein
MFMPPDRQAGSERLHGRSRRRAQLAVAVNPAKYGSCRLNFNRTASEYVMEIEIIFQTWDGGSPVRLRLSPDEYFDPIEPDETYEEDAIAKCNHTWEYLNVPREQLRWTMERRAGTSDDRTIYTQYLDGGRSWMTHRVDQDGYEEMIHVTQVDDRSCHIVRTVKTCVSGRWAVCLNSLIVDQTDGSQREQRFDKPWTDEGIKQYCDLPRTASVSEVEEQVE